MLDLARVAKLHEAATAAGLPGVLAEDHNIEKDSMAGTLMLINNWGDYVGPVVSQAAVAWWLRGWCLANDEAGQYGSPFIPSDAEGGYYLAWAEEIVAVRKANP